MLDYHWANGRLYTELDNRIRIFISLRRDTLDELALQKLGPADTPPPPS